MSRFGNMLLTLQLVFYLKLLTPVLGYCPNGTDTRIECQNYQCPGATHSCNYDRESGKYLCDSSCPINNLYRDPCTCLAKYEGCHIQQNATDIVSQPTYKDFPQTTYGCVNAIDRNCQYDVHVLSAYEGNGDIESWARVLSAGNTTVVVSVNGTGSKSQLVLVLLSHYQMNWVLDIPTGVVIDKVLLSSYHMDISDVSYRPGSVLSVEKVTNKMLPFLANGFDAYGNHTLQALEYLTERFGPVASFTGTSKADKWMLTINRHPQDLECSPMDTHPPVSQPSSPVVSTQCHPLSTSTRGSCYINVGATCSGDGYCRCPNMDYRDECTCLVKFGSCAIEKSALGDNSTGVPTYRGRTQITSSCVANDNCHNSVHVISMYKTHLQNPGAMIRPGTVNVHVSVTGEDDKPLILILTSYYPIKWRLNVLSGVVFDKVILSSYDKYLDQTSLNYSSGGEVSSIEKLNCSTTVQCYANGYNDATVEQLKYLMDRFGPVSSWSSAYRTDTWDLNITRQNGCSSNSPTGSGKFCPVIPWTSTHSLTVSQPSSSSAISLDSNKISMVVGSIGVTVLLLIIILVIFIATFKYRSEKINTGSTYSHRMSYRQLLRDSNFHQMEEWPSLEYNGPHSGMRIDCAPPPYHTVVTLSQSMNESMSSSSNSSSAWTSTEDPPPYPYPR